MTHDPAAAHLSALAKHEVLHTASLMMEFWETHVAGHHVVSSHPALRDEADRVLDAIVRFHRLCGAPATWPPVGVDAGKAQKKRRAS